MTYIGLDPATRCGWCVIDDDGARIVSGVTDLSKPTKAQRAANMRTLLADLLDAYPGSVVCYEVVRRHRGTAAAHVYGAIEQAILEVCDLRNIEPLPVEVAAIKRCATGNGAAKKPDMVAAATRRWGIRVKRDDEADALWCAEAGRLETLAGV